MGYFEEHGEQEGTVTILDTLTGKTATDFGNYGFYWSEGNGSCDCNRETLFDIETEGSNCINCERYLIIKHDYPGYSLDEMNSDYSQKLKDKHLC